jgi:Tol biopolymer transport system component
VDNDGDEGTDSSLQPAISDNGRFVAFYSYASDLVPDDGNGFPDIFVHDRKLGTTELISSDSDGNEGTGSSFSPDISANGRYIVYGSESANLVPGDNNFDFDIFIHDRKLGTTERISVSPGGADALGPSFDPDISANGRFVTYSSLASGLVPEDDDNASDVFVYDREKGTTELVSVSSNGTEGNLGSAQPTISDDGRYVTFQSDATNLVPGDDNNATDVFVRDRETDTTTLLSVARGGTTGNGGSFEPAISGNGHYVAYTSSASDLVSDDDNGFFDIFVAERFDWLL